MVIGMSSGRLQPFFAYVFVFTILHSSLHVHASAKDDLRSPIHSGRTIREPSAASNSGDQYIQLDELSKLAVDGALLAVDLRNYVSVQHNRLDRLLR